MAEAKRFFLIPLTSRGRIARHTLDQMSEVIMESPAPHERGSETISFVGLRSRIFDKVIRQEDEDWTND